MDIKLVKMSKQQWEEEVPEIIFNLTHKYGFYYSQSFANITKMVQEIVSSKKDDYKSRMNLYTNRNTQQWYFVIYCKEKRTIYWCDEYKYDVGKPLGRRDEFLAIKRFTDSFSKRYNDASELREAEKEMREEEE